VETAAAIAAPHELVPQIRPSLGECRFGGWEGLTFEELDKDPEWHRFNTNRSLVRPPSGETMGETQVRIVDELAALRQRHENQTVAVVSHCDPLRSAVAYYLGIPLNLMLRFEISPGSVSIVHSYEEESHIECLNYK
jgi:broad specificity phosphatase PhoE